MHSATLLKAEVKALQAANEQKKRRERKPTPPSSTQISSSTSLSSVTASSGSSTTPPTTTTSRPTSTSASSTTSSSTITGVAALPSCGQLCFNNTLAQYTDFGCTSPDPYCIFNNVNFGYGLRDCSNDACGTDVASTVITFGSAYCSAASATHTGTVTNYGRCTSPDPKCVCSNVNFGYGLRDCSNGACGTDVASTVIAFGSSYCGSATASQAVSPTSTACQVVSGLASPVPSGAICGSKGTSFAATGAGTIIGAWQHRAVQISISSNANLATCTMDQTVSMPLEIPYMISMMPHVSHVGS
ncbi:hypothetical protein V499_03311 [Pseudogymnoascus sp. VKM F-103]|nr:hypothetical protein V499_03311 [Pseudogymnoascus sp. VKM F-103]